MKRGSSARRGAVVALGLAVAGCGASGGGSDTGDGPVVVFELPGEGGTVALDRAPFPSDVFIETDDDGVRTIVVGGIERFAPRFAEVMKQGLATLDGFGTTTPVLFQIDGALDPRSLPATPAESLEEGASVFLVEVEPGVGVPARHPAEVHYDAERARLAVLPAPGHPLRERRRYAAVITDRVRGLGPDGGSGPARASAQFLVVRDDARSIREGGPIERAASAYEPALEILETLPDLDRRSIAGLAVFTTQSITRELLSIRGDLERMPPSRLDRSDPGIARLWDSPAELDALFGVPEGDRPGFGNPGGIVHDAIRAVVSGTYESPWYKTEDIGLGQRALRASHVDDAFESVEGRPVQQRVDDVPVTFVIPDRPQPPSGYPVVVDLHGLGGERSSMFGLANTLARAGYVAVGIDAVGHGMRYTRRDEEMNLTDEPGSDGFAENPPEQVSVGVFEGFLSIPAIRDNFRQTAVDLMTLVRMLRDPQLDLSVVGSPRLDPTRIFFVGNSFGGITGAVFTAVEPDVRASVLNVAGAGYTNYLLVNSPSIGGGNLPTISALFGWSLDPYPDRFDPFVAVAQTILEAGDAASYARHLVNDPLAVPGLGRNPPHDILQIEVMGDEVVPNPANEHLAVAAGLDLLEPFAAPVEGLATIAGPVRGNRVVDGIEATAVLVQQNPAAHGSNLVNARGRLSYVPGFPLPGPVPFPERERDRIVEHPVEETQGMVLDFFDSSGRGRAVVRSSITPEPFAR